MTAVLVHLPTPPPSPFIRLRCVRCEGRMQIPHDPWQDEFNALLDAAARILFEHTAFHIQETTAVASVCLACQCEQHVESRI